MFSRPFQADNPISTSSRISSEPCRLTPSSPLAASKGTHSNSVACQASAQGSGRVTVPRVAVSGHNFSVPAISTAISDSSTPMAGAPMSACSANKVSVCASWLASSRQNSTAIIRPMPMPKSRHSTKRANANSAPRMLPV